MLRTRLLLAWSGVAAVALIATLMSGAAASAGPCDIVKCPPDGTVTVSSETTIPGVDPTTGGGGGPVDCYHSYTGAPITDPLRSYVLVQKGLQDTGQVIYQSDCQNAGADGNGLFSNYYIAGVDPPPDPTVIATQVSARIVLPEVQIQFGPDRDEVAVNVPVWLSIADPGHPTDGETERGLTVTMTASVQSLSFDLGQPGTGSVSCAGLGSAPGPNSDLSRPPCGATFTQRSLPERTGGAGTWQVTVTVTWAMNWVASNGQAGTLIRTSVSDAGVYVGEFRTVIVTG